MKISNDTGIHEFLREQPMMALRMAPGGGRRLLGRFTFEAVHANFGRISDEFELDVALPADFPRTVPEIRETGGKIPKNGKFHVNDDGSFCLGSPMNLAMRLARNPTFGGFVKTCLIPYLYGVAYKLKNGEFPFGELRHGIGGELDDYRELLGLNTNDNVLAAFHLLGLKKRVANKYPCPCCCGRRLGKSHLHLAFNELRITVGRAWFRDRREALASYCDKQRLR